MAGKRPAINERSTYRLIEALRLGMARQDACKYANMSRRTFYRWKKIAEAQIEEDKPGQERQFWERVLRAEDEAEVEALKTIRHAVKKDRDWKAAAWLLERRQPHRYSLRPERFEREREENARRDAEARETQGAGLEATLEKVIDKLSPSAAHELMLVLQGGLDEGEP